MNAAELKGRMWLDVGGAGFVGAGRVRLLELIAETGSISQAAKEMGMSYRAAWFAVEAMNNLAEHALVRRVTGGRNGGGTEVTQAGRDLIARFRSLEAEYRQMLTMLQYNADDPDGLSALLSRPRLRVSARNQLRGTVTRLENRAFDVLVRLNVSGADMIVASVTPDSANELRLERGSTAYALIKAPAIQVSPGHVSPDGECNVFAGYLLRCATSGGTSVEASVALSGGRILTGVIVPESFGRALPAAGDAVTARFNPSDVIIGVEA